MSAATSPLMRIVCEGLTLISHSILADVEGRLGQRDARIAELELRVRTLEHGPRRGRARRTRRRLRRS